MVLTRNIFSEYSWNSLEGDTDISNLWVKVVLILPNQLLKLLDFLFIINELESSILLSCAIPWLWNLGYGFLAGPIEVGHGNIFKVVVPGPYYYLIIGGP